MSLFSRWRRLRELEPQVAYEAWADVYPPRAHNELMHLEEAAMEARLQGWAGSRALDLGTGTGRNLRALRTSHARTVVGVDLSAAMLSRAERRAGALVRADTHALPFPDHVFPLACASLMVGDVEDLPAWCREIARVLEPSGRLLYSDFHPRWSERGWQRAFRGRDGRTRRVAYHPHTIDDHRDALGRAGLRILQLDEPALEGDPVLVVVVAQKGV